MRVADATTITVVLAAQNAPLVHRQLDALANQTGNPPFTLTVVLGPTDADVTAPASRSGRTGPQRTDIVRGPCAGAAAARNLGAFHHAVDHSSTNQRSDRSAPVRPAHHVLLFCDADDIVGPGWVSAMAAGVRSYTLVGGPIRVDWQASPRWTWPLYQHLCCDGLQRFAGDAPYVLSASLGIEGTLFGRLGGFNAGFPGAGAEDIDLCLRAAAVGAPPQTITNPQATITYRPRTDLISVARQRMSYARGAAQLCAIHRLPPVVAVNPGSWRTLLTTLSSLRRTLVAAATVTSFLLTRWSLRRS